MNKILFLVVPNGYRDEEYDIPKKVFESNGYTVITSSDMSGTVKGKLGTSTAHVDILLKDVMAKDYDALAIAGGQPYFWNNAKVLSLVQYMHENNKPVGAICISGCIPAQAGIMNGRRCTVFETPDSVKEIEKNGAIYTGEDVTVDGNVVTANGPKAAERFALTIIELLNKLH